MDQIKFHHNPTLVMGKVRCLVGQAALLVGFLGGSVMMVDMARVVKKIRASSVFWVASDACRVSCWLHHSLQE